MRSELELTEKIEQYLQGKLSPSEKLDFEKEIQSDPSLRMEVDAQKEIMQNIERVSLKERAKNAYAKYLLRRRIRNWSLGGVVIIVLALGINYYVAPKNNDDQKHIASAIKGNTNQNSFTYDPGDNSNQIQKENKSKKEFAKQNVDENPFNTSDTTNFFCPHRLPKQSFFINNKRDTVLKSRSGMIIRIPKNTFALGGNSIDKPVKIELIEALTKKDMVLGGLTTVADSTILESGGMFKLNAKIDDLPAEIANDKSIQTYIPSKKIDKKMKLYSGEQTKPSVRSTKLNWRDPRPLAFTIPGVLVHVNNRIVTDTFGYFQPVIKYKKDKHGKRIKDEVSASDIYTEKTDSDFCYSCNITRINPEQDWLNADRPWVPAYGERIDFAAEVSNQSEFKCISVCIVMNSINVSYNARQRKDKTFSFSRNDSEKQRMPVGEYATVIANAYKNGKYYFAIKKIKIEDKEKVSLKLVLSSEKEIKETLAKGL